MREIKFRAWVNEDDTEYSRMVYSPQAIITAIRHVYGKTGVASQAGFSDCNNQPQPDRYILMQYTGLKDKNGKEIYEGDILTVNSIKNYKPCVVKFGLHGAFNGWYVEWEGETTGELNDSWNWGGGEVIGNIYENPELVGKC